MSEYVREPSGWKTISYDSKGKRHGSKSDGAPLTADGMDEGADSGSEAAEAPEESGEEGRPL
jgi:hypothetical protein